MTRFALLFALIALVATSARAQESAPEAPPLSATVAAAIEGTTVPALGLLVIRDGQVVDQAVAGVRELGSRSAVTATTAGTWGPTARP